MKQSYPVKLKKKRFMIWLYQSGKWQIKNVYNTINMSKNATICVPCPYYIIKLATYCCL